MRETTVLPITETKFSGNSENFSGDISTGDLVHLYRQGLSIRQVADRIGWRRGRVQRRLQKAGVTRSCAEGFHLAKRAVPFDPTPELQELVDGLLLSDATIEARVFGGRLSIGQSGRHQPWVVNLKHQLDRLGVESSLSRKKGGATTIKGKTAQRKERTTLRTRTYEWFKEQRVRWYTPEGIKIVPRDVFLGPQSLTGWICGDGVRAGKGYRIEFCTDGFPPENVEWLVSELNLRFGWSATISDRNRVVICRQADRDSLIKMVGPLVPTCFQHKLKLKKRSPVYKLDDQKREELASLRKQGWSMDRLAAHFTMSRSGVYSSLVKLGLQTRVPRTRWS